MVIKSVTQTVEYTTDNPFTATPTWTEIPVIKILSESGRPEAEAQTTETLNGLQVQTAEVINGSYIVGVDDEDTFLDALRSAADDWTPVWFREQPTAPAGQTVLPRIIGGRTGCAVTYTRQRQEFGNVGESITIGFSATGGFADESFDIGTGAAS